jgi:hypothetical protein
MPKKFYHYSDVENLKEIDPSFYGKHGKFSPEFSQGTHGMVPRSYVYLEEDKPEPAVAKGRYRYEGTLPEDWKLYDLSADEHRLADSLKQKGLKGRDFYDALEHEIYQKGFHGYYNPKSKLSHVAAIFHKIPLDKSDKEQKQISLQNVQDLDKLLSHGDFALMSPYHYSRSPEENEKKHAEFLEDLKRTGKRFLPVIGKWNQQVEPSYLIENLPKETASFLAQKYGQYAHIQSSKGRHEDISHSKDYISLSPGEGHQIGDFDDNYSEVKIGDKPVKFKLNLGHKASIEKSEYLSLKIKKADISHWDSGEERDSKVYVAMDGDNAGSQVERAAMRNDKEAIKDISERIKAGSEAVRAVVEKMGGEIIVFGGDDIGFYIDEKQVPFVDSLRSLYLKHAGFTITAGVHPNISKAVHALLYGKITGKNKTVYWNEKIESELSKLTQAQTPEEKASKLLGKKENLTKDCDSNWEKEGYQLKHYADEHGIDYVIAYHPKYGNVGEFAFIKDGTGSGGCSYPLVAEVEPDHRGKGIASAVCDLIEQKTGKPVKLSADQTKHSSAFEKKRLGKNSLEKGSRQRKIGAPMTAHTQLGTEEQKKIHDWQISASPRIRSSIPRLEGPTRERALQKLAAATKVRRNPITNEREFLLHRGVSGKESRVIGNKRSFSSWTPKYDVAAGFAEDRSDESDSFRENVHSRWIPEKYIHHLPMMYTNLTEGFKTDPTNWKGFRTDYLGHKVEGMVPDLRNEFEVIVSPYGKNTTAAHPEDVMDFQTQRYLPSRLPDPDQAINARALGRLMPYSNPQNVNKKVVKEISDRLRSRKKSSKKAS